MSKNTKVNWTENELKIVFDNYLKPNAFSIFKEMLPQRSYNQIKAQANLMSLKRRVSYSKDELFFSEISCANAWVAGFIAADGYINIKNRRVHINLSEKDLNYLTKIKEATKYTGPIHIRRPKKSIVWESKTKKEYVLGKNKIATLMIGKSGQWIADLSKNWNINTQKTFDLKPPNICQLNIALAYISGLIDGDGWITWNSKRKDYLRISIMGTKEMMIWIKSIFDKITPQNTKAQILKTNSFNIYTYCVSGARAIVLAKIFFSLDIYRMERKWNKAREYLKYFEQKNKLDYRTVKALELSKIDSNFLNFYKFDDFSNISSPSP